MTRWSWLLVVGGALGGAYIPLHVFSRNAADVAWWYYPATLLLGFVPGVLLGWSFAHRERDVAVPTAVGGAVAAFLGALATPFLVAVVIFLARGGGD